MQIEMDKMGGIITSSLAEKCKYLSVASIESVGVAARCVRPCLGLHPSRAVPMMEVAQTRLGAGSRIPVYDSVDRRTCVRARPRATRLSATLEHFTVAGA
jgi:hypothetical protein